MTIVSWSCGGDGTCLVLSAPGVLQTPEKATLGDLGESALPVVRCISPVVCITNCFYWVIGR